jgi:hypothetical protein
MASVDAWIIHAANVTVGKALGIVFDQAIEIVAPIILIGGIIAAWIAFRPRKPKY